MTIPHPLIPLSTTPLRSLCPSIPLNLAAFPVIIVFLKAAQCIPWSVIREGISGGRSRVQQYNILILLFSLPYIAISSVQTPLPSTDTDLTGILQSAAFWVRNKGGASRGRRFFCFYLLTTGLSAILGNDPVLSGAAFLVYFTKVVEVSPIAWLFSEFASCNTAFKLFFVGTSAAT